jgi:hypothetical protein
MAKKRKVMEKTTAPEMNTTRMRRGTQIPAATKRWAGRRKKRRPPEEATTKSLALHEQAFGKCV